MGGLAYRGPVFTWSAQRHSHCWAAHWPQADVQTQLVPPSSEGQSELPAEASSTGCKAADDAFSDPRVCPKPSLQEEADPGDGIAEAAPPTMERPPQGAVWSWTAPHCPQHHPPCHPPSQTSGGKWACCHRLGPSDLSCSLEVPSGQVKPGQGGQHRASGLGSRGHPAPTPARGGVQHLQKSSPSWPSATRRRFKNSQESNSINSGFIEKQQHWGPSRQPGPQHRPPTAHTPTGSRRPHPALARWPVSAPLEGYGIPRGLRTVAAIMGSWTVSHRKCTPPPRPNLHSARPKTQRPQQLWSNSLTQGTLRHHV